MKNNRINKIIKESINKVLKEDQRRTFDEELSGVIEDFACLYGITDEDAMDAAFSAALHAIYDTFEKYRNNY